MIELYPHQAEFVSGLRASMARYAAVMGQAPTGSGKTVVGSFIAQSATKKGKRVIFAVHRDNLVRQTSLTFREFGIQHGFIVSGMTYEPYQPVHVASISTLQRRLDKIKAPDLLVIDEAHMAAAKTWAKVVKHYRDRGSRILGFSATPSRFDGKPLSDLFDTIVSGPPVRWLMDRGFLSEYTAFCPKGSVPLELEGVHSMAGDYKRDELDAALGKSSIMGDGPVLYARHAAGTRALCYCASITRSQASCAAFNAAGIPAAHMDGNTPKTEQQAIIRDFADGKILVLCNVELMTTGFDLSAQVGRDVPVEAIIMQRPTQSLALHLQMIGRGLRKKAAPAILIDQAGNMARWKGGQLSVNLGFPDDTRDWTLDGTGKKGKQAAETALPIRQCEECFTVHRPAPRCPKCGFLYPVHSREIDMVEGELAQVSPDEVRKVVQQAKARAAMDMKREQAEARSLEQLTELAAARGYRNPPMWAKHVWQARQQRGMRA